MARLQLGVDIEVEGARDLKRVADNLDDASSELDGVASGLDDAAEAADDAARAVERVADSADTATRDLGRSVDGLADAGRGAVDTISGIGQLLEGDIAGGVQDLAAGLFDIGSGIIEGVIPAFTAVKAGALTSASAVASSIGAQIAAWATLGVQSLLHAAKVAAAWVIATGPVGLLVAAIVAAVALIILNWDAVVDFFEGAFKAIGEALEGLGRWFGEVWNGIISFLTGIMKAISRIGKDLWRPIGEGFKAAIGVIKGIWNAFARWWNGIQLSVPAVDVPFVGRVGGFTIGLPDLPMLAQGGIVDRPTLALIGERGPEAVVPLDRASGMGQELHIHLENHGPPIKDDDDVIDALKAIAPMLDGRLAYGG